MPVSEVINILQGLSHSNRLRGPLYTDMSDVARYLVCGELITSGLTKFDDRPDWAWKSPFAYAIEGLQQSASE